MDKLQVLNAIKINDYPQVSRDLKAYFRAIILFKRQSLRKAYENFKQNKSVSGYYFCKKMVNNYHCRVLLDFSQVFKKYYAHYTLANAFEIVEIFFKIFEHTEHLEFNEGLNRHELINSISHSLYSISSAV